MSATFRETLQAVRAQVLSAPSNAMFGAARARHAVLGKHATAQELLDVMHDESPGRWSEREAVTRSLIAEQQRGAAGGLWASLLLCAYYPMLSRLRHRIYGHAFDDEDLDQLVISCFLQVVAELDLAEVPDRTALRLRQRTERRVFKTVRLEQDQHRGRAELDEELVANEDDPREAGKRSRVEELDPEETVALLLDVAGDQVPGSNLDLVVSTMLKKEKLRAYVARVNGEGEPDERVYQRLKRRRSRTVNRLRDLLEGALGPRSEACAL